MIVKLSTMKNLILSFLMTIITLTASYGQVSISTDNSQPDPSAMLDVKSTSRGVLLPRVALTSLDSPNPIANPAIGLLVYNTTTSGNPPFQVVEGYYHWSGVQWIPIATAKGNNKGDMQFWNGIQWVNVPVGMPGQYLQLNSENVPTWTGAHFASVHTLPVHDLTDTSATSGGDVLSDGGSEVILRGLCWNTSSKPTISDQVLSAGQGVGSFEATVHGLLPGTQYFIRAFAQNSAGVSYGEEYSFTTYKLPVVTTDSVTNISQNHAIGWGTVTDEGGTMVTQRGFCFSTQPYPTITDSVVPCGNGAGSFSGTLSTLLVDTQYYIRAFAINSVGIAYGDNRPFSTLPPAVLPEVITDTVGNITNLTATCGGTVTFDGYSPVTARGICWSLLPNPDTSAMKSLDGQGTGPFTSQMTGLLSDTVYFVRAYAINEVGIDYGNEVSFRTQPDAPQPCPGVPTVDYGGKTYNTVLIGNRCWFKENLDFGTRIDGSNEQTDNNVPEKYCLFNLDSNCTKYGGLYQWNELSNYVNLSGGRGLCPEGWHVPSADEFFQLVNLLGGTTTAGGKLKEAGYAHWSAPNLGATNRSGFTALPGGFKNAGNYFSNEHLEADFWGSTIQAGGSFTGLLLTSESDDAVVNFYANNGLGFSARCIKDTCETYSSATINITPSENQVCAGANVSFNATVTNGGANPFYQWKVNGVKTGTDSSSFGYVPSNNDNVTCTLYSSSGCVSNPTVSNTVVMTVNPVLPVSLSISASANNICSGTSVTFTAVPINGGSTPAYQWRKDGTEISGATQSTYNYTPANGDAITCRLTSSVNCPSGNPVLSNSITMAVNPSLPVSVSINATATTICAGTMVTFTATPVNGGTTPAYQWKKGGSNISGATQSTYTYAPSNGDAITCQLTSSASCATGNPATSAAISMTVNPNSPVSISISASTNNVCAGTTVNFTATPVNGGTSPTFQWKKGSSNISGATSSTYSYNPVNGDVITCQLTSNVTCPTGNPATSNSITMTVNPLQPVSLTIGASATTVCSGTSVTFTATTVNGGPSPAYQWKKGGSNISGATLSTYSYTPANGDVIACTLTSNATCATGSPATSNSISMTVNPLNPVSVSIAASANNICSGTSVTYTATPTNGGTTPQYQWKKGGSNISGATLSTYSYTPVNGDVITCQLTSSISCPSGNPALSNSVTMTVIANQTVGVSIAASSNPVCSGTSVTFTATPTNGGTSPQYQWKKGGTNISGATNATYSYIPLNGEAISCQMTSNASCISGNPATSNVISMTVNSIQTVSISISASANDVCAGASVTFTATPVNGGTSPAYQWKKGGSNIGGATASTYSYSPVNGDVISCQLTSNASCISGNPATSNSITMVVAPTNPVSVSISGSANNICSGTSVTFTATPANGGTSPAYQWFKNSAQITGATNVTYSYAPANGDVITCRLTSNISCPTGNPATSNAITMQVTSVVAASVNIAASANPSCDGNSVTYTATPTNGGTNPGYQWRKNTTNISGATDASYSYTPENNDVVTCEMTSSLQCVSGSPATSNQITMTVNPLQNVSISIAASANPVCAGTSVTFTATTTNGGSSPTYIWFVNSVSVSGATGSTYSFIPVNGDMISCHLISSIACPSVNPAVSNTITMTVNQNNPVSVSVFPSSFAVVSGTSVTYTATPVNGGTNPVYAWKKNGASVGTNSPTYSYTPANNDNIYCIMTSNLTSCVTGSPATSNTVNMIVYTTGTACNPATVTYGGRIYNTVTIGTQCWLRENINIGTAISATVNQTNNGIIEKYCYNNDTNFCNVYGGLYQWAEVVQYLNNATNTSHWNPIPTGNVQGVCPPGWHIPKTSEITTMTTYMGGVGVAGGKMKETGLVHWYSPNSSAANTYGYTALGSGGVQNGSFSTLKSYGYLWNASAGTTQNDAYTNGTAYNSSGSLSGQVYKITGYPVRCLKD